MNVVAESLRDLASLLRSGLDVRSALVAWPEAAPSSARPSVAAVARRIRMGDDPARAVTLLGAEGGPLAALVDGHTRAGGDLAAAVDAYAACLEHRARARARAAAAGAGARLSARLVAGLPLLFVPFLPAPRGGLDGSGLALIAAGASLSLLGLWWIERLLPQVDRLTDPIADAATLVAGLVAAGAPPERALVIASDDVPELRSAARAARLGAPWPDALARSRALEPLAAPLRRAVVYGVPAAAALAAEAARRRQQLDSDFEAAARRAPVLMAVPLALCVLPAYLLLGVVPLLRAG